MKNELKSLAGLVCAFIIFGCSESASSKGPLRSSPPPGWKLEYKGDGGTDFCSVTPKEAGKSLLMFSKWPPLSKVEEIPELVRKLADGFATTAKQSNLELATEKSASRNSLARAAREATPSFESKATAMKLSRLYFMEVGGRIWNGQFTGTAEHWVEALEMLKSISAAR